MTTLSRTWGTETKEQVLEFPCDHFMEDYDDVYYRGVTINASSEVIFKWLCQMRVAPYSYDWLDNFGRRSPQYLIPGLDALEIGQTVMIMFKVIDFKKNKHITLRFDSNIPKMMGDTVICYVIVPNGRKRCRLLAKLLVKYPNGFPGTLVRLTLPMGDLIMMRRQLLNFKRLSERDSI